ncbi:MAG: hypothetical protein A2019_03690 [Sulfurimonas sp. GWF2_37_8]|nr:MAG: hypothetical protein A2019_03690 [Sulfurimonas sp. GWF2_37_8]
MSPIQCLAIHRMTRNYLKGFVGDQINLLMAACAWNLKKWMNSFIHALFLVLNIELLVLMITLHIKRWKLSSESSAQNALMRF